MVACLNSNLPILKILLDSADNQEELKDMVNHRNRRSMSPLHIACLLGDIKMCETLISCSAELIKYDQKGFLPIHYAIVKDHEPLIRYFIEVQKIKIFDPLYFCMTHTLLTLAIQNGSYNTVKMLVLDYHADVTEKDKLGFTYLHIAAVSGHVNIFLFFLSKQVSLHSKNANNETALDLAKKHGHIHLIKYLKDKFEANLNAGLSHLA